MDSNFTTQEHIMIATGSEISISGSSFRDITVNQKFLRISESDISISTVTFDNITCQDTALEILHLVKAYAEINTFEYRNSN